MFCRFLLLQCFAVFQPMLLQAETPTPSNLILVLDASGSMWGQIGGKNKIVIAREALRELISKLPATTRVGLVAYGHRSEGDCGDIEVLSELEAVDAPALTAAIEALNPKGKTPITTALEKALGLVPDDNLPVTVVLVSDGLETCGGDPCALIRSAREKGASVVTHVVGFDLQEDDLAQLECTAQAGGGLYFNARDAEALSAALERAMAAPAELPAGGISIKAIANGELIDAGVTVTEIGGGESVSFSRTYSGPNTNPRFVPLPPGNYAVRVEAISIHGRPGREFADIRVEEAVVEERTVDFSTGTLHLGVGRNGRSSDATYQIYIAGEKKAVTGGRTYTSPEQNPAIITLLAGTYDIHIRSVEISGRPEHEWKGVSVGAGETAELRHEFQSGELRVGATMGGALADAVVRIVDAGSGTPVTQGRTYTSAKSNPKTFIVAPGTYRITAKSLKGSEEKVLDLEVKPGAVTEHMFDFHEVK